MASHASVSARPMWGLTVTGPRQSETIERALAVGLFDTVEATWNLLERSATRALERAAIRGRRYQAEDQYRRGQRQTSALYQASVVRFASSSVCC